MSKGIIIVSEVPTHCRDCDYFGQFCKITGTKTWYNKNGREDDCPIRELPEEITFDFDRAIESLEKQVKK